MNERARIVRLGARLSGLFLVGCLAACFGGGPLNEKAYVGPEKLRLKSSTAQAARYVAELKGGDPVTITDREDAEDGTSWAEVRGPGGETGWAEVRFLVKAELVDEARRIAEQSRQIPTQAIGKSKAALKLRLTPDRATEENVAILIPSGTLMEIVARERKPRPAIKEADNESDDPLAPPPSNVPPDVKYDDWFLVRIKDFSVVPAGWIYGGSVGLEIPPEIIYFVSEGRRISGWHKIGTFHEEDGRTGDHYLVLEHKLFEGNDEMDFDRVKVLAYDPGTRNYSTPFREDVSGRYPVTLNMNGTRGQFKIKAIDKNGQARDLSYEIEMLDAGRIKVTKTPGPTERPTAQ